MSIYRMARRRILVIFALSCICIFQPGNLVSKCPQPTIEGSSASEKLNTLLSLAQSSMEDSMTQALEYGKQALELATAIQDKRGEALAAFYCGKIYRGSDEFDQALQYQQTALALFKDLKEKYLAAQTIVEIGLNYFGIPDIEKAIFHFESARKVYSELNDSSGISVTLNNLGRCYRKTGDLDKALDYALKSLKFKEVDNHNAYNTISIVYAIMGDTEKALEYQKESLDIRKKLGLEDKLVGSLNNMGLLYIRLGKHDQALAYLQQSAELANETGKKLDYCRALNNIGYVYEEIIGDLPRALEYFEKSLAVSDGIDEYYEKANIQINIGGILSKQRQYHSALRYLQAGIELSKKLGAKEITQNGYQALTDHYYRIGEYQKALESFKQHVAARDSIFNQQTNDRIAEMQVKFDTERKERENEIYKLKIERARLHKSMLTLGIIIFLIITTVLFIIYRQKSKITKLLAEDITKQEKIEAELQFRVKQRTRELENKIGEHKKAELELSKSNERYQKLFETAANLIISVDRQGQIVDCNERIYNVLGYTKKAVIGLHMFQLIHPDYHQKAAQSLQEIMKNGYLYGMEYVFLKKSGDARNIVSNSSALKEGNGRFSRTICILTDVTERMQAAEQIKKDLHEKEILIRELYHRTKNNMQVICSLLQLQALRSTDRTVKNIFKEIETKIHSMALVHQKLISSNDLSHLSLKDYFNSLITLIKNSYATRNNVTFQTDMTDICVLMDTAVPFGLVFHELIVNVLKHAFPHEKGGVVKVKLSLSPQKEIVLEISDNGTGLPEHFDIKNDGHLGLETVFALVEHQLNGKISFKNNNGLHYKIVLDKEELYETRV